MDNTAGEGRQRRKKLWLEKEGWKPSALTEWAEEDSNEREVVRSWLEVCGGCVLGGVCVA